MLCHRYIMPSGIVAQGCTWHCGALTLRRVETAEVDLFISLVQHLGPQRAEASRHPLLFPPGSQIGSRAFSAIRTDSDSDFACVPGCRPVPEKRGYSHWLS